jgi:hypothetical protein
MKAFKSILTGTAAILILWTLSSCEQNIAVESSVNADGSVDRTIVLSKTDSARSLNNIFGISQRSGWDVSIDSARAIESKADKDKKDIVLRKHFATVEEMNAEMNADRDTLFKIQSVFEKKFRWFYTYIRYSDTYQPINRFKSVKIEDYFTPEDFAFIDRLPAEGKPIGHADSVYLIKLNEKIYDHFAMRGLFEEQFNALSESLKQSSNPSLADTLERKKERMFHVLMAKKDDIGDEFMTEIADTMGIPSRLINVESFKSLNKNSERRIDFMSSAAEGKFVHSIRMPWNITKHNGDSISNNVVTWNPPVIKFMLKEYTMMAESRRINYWAVILSVTLIAITILAFVRKQY